MTNNNKLGIEKQIIGLAAAVVVLVASIVILGNARPEVKPSKAYMTGVTRIGIIPHKIKPNDPYTLNISYNGALYTGALDEDLTICKLDFSVCNDYSGPWKTSSGTDWLAVNGVVSIPAGLNFPAGYYMLRIKPRGTTSAYYSDFELLVVDTRTSPLTWTFGTNTISIPTPGSYVILKNYDATNNFIGFTRIDIETDQCDLGGFTMRFTKTRNNAYFNSPWPSQLRWCVNSSFRALGGLKYEAPAINSAAQQVSNTVENATLTSLESYPNSNLVGDNGSQALLGGYWINNGNLDTFHAPPDMPRLYDLLTDGNKIPTNLSGSFQTYEELSFGHPWAFFNPPDTGLDTWHMELKQPNIPGSAMTVRYIETGRDTRMKNPRWQTTEDWTWSQAGLITQIKKWTTEVKSRCWDPIYTCGNVSPDIRAELVESYIPDSRPLSLTMRDPSNGNISNSSLRIASATSYEVIVKKADGTPYSGFLEGLANGNKFLWTSTNKVPVYVSGGSVTVPPVAYGNLTNFNITWEVRPYLTNSTLNSLYPIPSGGVKPNTSTAAFSNPMTLQIGP